jgi:hypothetical protein
MHPGYRALLRIAGMSASLLAVFGLYRGTIAGPELSVFQTVYLQCILLLVSLGYYLVLKLCSLACAPRSRAPVEEARIQIAKEFLTGGGTLTVPRLTIWNVWVLVYGLGFVFFITGYCFLGLHPICMAFLGLAIGVLAVDEIACPRASLWPAYVALRALVLGTVVIALVLVSADLFDAAVAAYVTTLDLYSIFFALLLPFCSQFILVVVRDSRRSPLGGVIEICEFGFPFTAFLGIFHLCVAYGQRFQSDVDAQTAFERLVYANNQTQQEGSLFDFRYWYHYNATQALIETHGPSLVFYSLTPFLVVPALVCYLTCVLEGCAVDPLIALTFALSVQHLITRASGPTSPLGIAGMVFSSLSVVLRVVCEFRPGLTAGEIYRMQGEQLGGQETVWSRRREAEALTSDFQTEMAMLT